MPSPIHLRRATPADRDGIFEVLQARARRTPEDLRAFLDRVLDRHEQEPDQLRVMVAETQGQVIAWSRVAWFAPPAEAPANAAPAGWYLIGLSVLPPWRRQGLGTHLTVDRLDWLSGRTAEVWTFTDHDNVASLRLHEELGFVEVTRDFWFPGLSDPDTPLVLLRAPVG